MSSPRISALTTGMSRTAAMHARAKNDMKPSPMPCCFWKRSLCSARSAITSLMSISLKVVRIAAVRCAWTRRSAIRRRMGLIGTRSSPSTRAADGVGAAGTSIRTGRGRRGARAPVLLDARHQLADRDLLACGLHDAQHAGPLGGELHARLVGLELEQDVVRLDRLAVLLRPAHDDPLGHRLAECRDAHLERHAALRLRTRPSGPARSSPGRAPRPGAA